MRVRDIDQRDSAHPGPRLRVSRQQRRLGILLVEIFEDGQRLEQLDLAVDQRRHHHLRVDCPILGSELVALFEMQEAVPTRDALQVKRDAHAEARLRAVICVKLHPSLLSPQPAAQIAGVRCPKKARRYSSITTKPRSTRPMTRPPTRRTASSGSSAASATANWRAAASVSPSASLTVGPRSSGSTSTAPRARRHRSLSLSMAAPDAAGARKTMRCR